MANVFRAKSTSTPVLSKSPRDILGDDNRSDGVRDPLLSRKSRKGKNKTRPEEKRDEEKKDPDHDATPA